MLVTFFMVSWSGLCVLLMFLVCFSCVSVASWRCSGGVLVVLRERYFFWTKLVHLLAPIGAKGNAKLCYWACMLGYFLTVSQDHFFNLIQSIPRSQLPGMVHVAVR